MFANDDNHNGLRHPRFPRFISIYKKVLLGGMLKRESTDRSVKSIIGNQYLNIGVNGFSEKLHLEW